MATLEEMGARALDASRALAEASTEQKNDALRQIAAQLAVRREEILAANAQDISAAREAGMRPAMLDRLTLSPERIGGMARGAENVAGLPDPTGRVESGWRRPNGLLIERVRVPLGVVGIIYEARPNVTADAACLCLKAGNACILRGGKEALRSNLAVGEALRAGAADAGLPGDCVQVLADPSHETARSFMRLNRYLDVLIPRGGAGLIRSVVENATVPVIETGVGNCHVYVDDSADIGMAASIINNAKTSRPSVCNAAETLLVHEKIAPAFLPAARALLDEKHVELRCDEAARAILGAGVKAASEEDWATEYNDYILAVKVVPDIDAAIAHINRYGTRHSEAIVTESFAHAQLFLRRVDAAAVYVNASTRFTDGEEFGFGAEIGISTQKLHARGPMGLEALTTTKYWVTGSGQIRE